MAGGVVAQIGFDIIEADKSGSSASDSNASLSQDAATESIETQSATPQSTTIILSKNYLPRRLPQTPSFEVRAESDEDLPYDDIPLLLGEPSESGRAVLIYLSNPDTHYNNMFG